MLHQLCQFVVETKALLIKVVAGSGAAVDVDAAVGVFEGVVAVAAVDTFAVLPELTTLTTTISTTKRMSQSGWK